MRHDRWCVFGCNLRDTCWMPASATAIAFWLRRADNTYYRYTWALEPSLLIDLRDTVSRFKVEVATGAGRTARFQALWKTTAAVRRLGAVEMEDDGPVRTQSVRLPGRASLASSS